MHSDMNSRGNFGRPQWQWNRGGRDYIDYGNYNYRQQGYHHNNYSNEYMYPNRSTINESSRRPYVYGRRGGRNSQVPAPPSSHNYSANYQHRGRQQSTYRGGGGPAPSTGRKFCYNYMENGECKYDRNCRYLHQIVRVSVPFTTNINETKCCTTVVRNGLVEIFVGSADGTLNHLMVSQDGIGEKFRIIPRNSSKLRSGVAACLCYGEYLFCSLQNGNIIASNITTWEASVLVGHTTCVHALLFVDEILISGGWDGEIRFWTFDNSTNRFNCIRTVRTQCKISCMKELSVNSPNCEIKRTLWVGGSLVVLIDLSNLEIAQTFNFQSAICVSLVKYGDSIVLGFAAGDLRIYSANGEELALCSCSFISCLEGLLVNEIPYLLCGTDDGVVVMLQLPDLEVVGIMKMKEEAAVKSIISLGEGVFLTCASTGGLNIWKWTPGVS